VVQAFTETEDENTMKSLGTVHLHLTQIRDAIAALLEDEGGQHEEG